TFAPRCRWAAAPCRQGSPPLIEVRPQRFSACIRLDEIRSEMVGLRERTQHEHKPEVAERDSSAMIEVRDLHKLFRNGNRSLAALDGVSLSVGRNESIGIVGEPGSGKTTLARILVGLEQRTSGEVAIDGVDASDWSKLSSRDRRKLRGTI